MSSVGLGLSLLHSERASFYQRTVLSHDPRLQTPFKCFLHNIGTPILSGGMSPALSLLSHSFIPTHNPLHTTTPTGFSLSVLFTNATKPPPHHHLPLHPLTHTLSLFQSLIHTRSRTSNESICGIRTHFGSCHDNLSLCTTREKEEEESIIDHRTSGDPFDKHSAAAEANKVWQNFFSSSEKTIFWRYCRFLEPMSSTNFSHSVGYALLK